MKPEYLNTKAFSLNDEIIWDCVSDKLLQALKMLTISATMEQCRGLFLYIIPIIRKFYNDFTMNDLASAIESGGYGLYGEFSKMNPQTIHGWLKRKRLELHEHDEKFEQRQAKRKEPALLTSNSGGLAVILGFAYDGMGVSLPFSERMALIDKKGICPFTNKPVMQVISEHQMTTKLLSGKK